MIQITYNEMGDMMFLRVRGVTRILHPKGSGHCMCCRERADADAGLQSGQRDRDLCR